MWPISLAANLASTLFFLLANNRNLTLLRVTMGPQLKISSSSVSVTARVVFPYTRIWWLESQESCCDNKVLEVTLMMETKH